MQWPGHVCSLEKGRHANTAAGSTLCVPGMEHANIPAACLAITRVPFNPPITPSPCSCRSFDAPGSTCRPMNTAYHPAVSYRMQHCIGSLIVKRALESVNYSVTKANMHCPRASAAPNHRPIQTSCVAEHTRLKPPAHSVSLDAATHSTVVVRLLRIPLRTSTRHSLSLFTPQHTTLTSC